jgi:hypothetical protein
MLCGVSHQGAHALLVVGECRHGRAAPQVPQPDGGVVAASDDLCVGECVCVFWDGEECGSECG